MSDSKTYHDLHTIGTGYFRHLRPVGDDYYVTIAALRGEVGSPEYSLFDCRIVGAKALDILRSPKVRLSLESDAKVKAKFKVGNIASQAFEHEGETRSKITGRLLRILWIAVDGELIELPSEPEPGETQAHGDVTSTDGSPWPGEPLPEHIALDKDDPDFEGKKARLKALGYRWNRTQLRWQLFEAPAV